jgi:hypothetical protein
MSFTITNAFVQAYAQNVYLLAQQKGSKLGDAVTVDGNATGTYKFYDQVGATTYNTVLNRNGDTPLNSTPFSRRRVQLTAKDWGDLIDDIDRLQMLIDPTSATAMVAAMSMGRAKDDTIISSFFATAYTNSGIEGVSPTTVSFPAGQIVAVDERTYQEDGNTKTGNSSMTVAKLIKAKQLFRKNNVDLESDQLNCALDSTGFAAMLSSTPVTSIWYNQVKPLVSGEISSFMGVNFIPTELVITDGLGNSLLNGSSYALIPIWAKSGVVLAVGKDPKAEIAKRADKRFSYQVYLQMFMGAARLEEVKVVQVLCDPTATH